MPRNLPALSVVRRIGDPPKARGSQTAETCPDVFELSDGSFAIIGTEATADLDPLIPAHMTRAEHERIVVIDRETIMRAKRDIPDA